MCFQVEIETRQTLFNKTKLNTVHIGVGTYQPTYQPNNYDWITSTANSKSGCKDDADYLIDIDNWSLRIEEVSLDYDEKVDKLILEGHTSPCLHFDGFCKPTLKHSCSTLWFPEKICFLFYISDFIEQMSQLNDRFWLEFDDFVILLGKTLETSKKS